MKNALKELWVKHSAKEDPSTYISSTTSEMEKKKSSLDRDLLKWFKLNKLWSHRSKNMSKSKELIKEAQHLSGATEKLQVQPLLKENDVHLVIIKGGQQEIIKFVEDRFVVGRNHTGVHYLDATDGISRVHCEFVKVTAGIEVKDLGSLNGTYLNGQLLVPYKSYPFISGDILKIVTTEIRLPA